MNSLAAAFIVFTKLPLYKWVETSTSDFKKIISYWSITGVFTAIVTVSILYLSSLILPIQVAIILAITSRILFTGAMHEDGLADFFDGFGGGGSNKSKVLSIMKDSHIGTYGVIALIIYFSVLISTLLSMPIQLAISAILIGDPLCKLISSSIPSMLPYVRREEESKLSFILAPPATIPIIISIIIIIIIILTLKILGMFPIGYISATLAPIALFLFLSNFIEKKIGGYTGDCCGAINLMCELSFYLTLLAISQ